MAGHFAKVNEQEIRELLDNTIPKIPCLSGNKTIIPIALVIYELIANQALHASLAMSSYTTRAHGIIVKYIHVQCIHIK